jgi:hypothetical protein
MSTIYLDETTDKLKDARDKCLKREGYVSSMHAAGKTLYSITPRKEIAKWLESLSVSLFIGLLVHIKSGYS